MVFQTPGCANKTQDVVRCEDTLWWEGGLCWALSPNTTLIAMTRLTWDLNSYLLSCSAAPFQPFCCSELHHRCACVLCYSLLNVWISSTAPKPVNGTCGYHNPWSVHPAQSWRDCALLVRTLPCLCWGHPQLTFLMLAALQQAVEVAGEKKVLQGVAGKERGMGEGWGRWHYPSITTNSCGFDSWSQLCQRRSQ